MPIITGDEFVSIVRSSKLNAHTPVILCASHINKLILTEMSRESKIYFLTKPFTSTALLELVKKVVSVEHSGVRENQGLNEKWLQAFSGKLTDLANEKIVSAQLDRLELWNFETIGVNF